MLTCCVLKIILYGDFPKPRLIQEITFQELAQVERLLLDVHLRFHRRRFTLTVIFQHYTELNM